MCSKVLNGHIILTDTSITTILAPEMTYTPVSYYGDRAYDLTEAGYGGIMHFNLRTRTDSDPLSLFNSIADGAWEETVTCENGNRPQDWTFVSSGYTITYDEATAE